MQRCWSCDVGIDIETGVSLDGSDEEFHVCLRCWKELSVRDRLELGHLFRSRSIGKAFDWDQFRPPNRN